jgi:hypothetical protein
MYFKRLLIATCALLLCASCAGMLPWRNAPAAHEVNLAFTLEMNLLYITSATVDGRPGRFLLGSAEPRSVLDSAFVRSVGGTGRDRFSLRLSERHAIAFAPVIADMHGVGDGIIGADVWDAHAVTIDYRAGLLTYHREWIHQEDMTLFSYSAEPRINLTVDGRSVSAIVDTASPDSLVLPRAGAPPSREKARVQIGETDFGTTDILRADVAAPRIGNRLLSKFLVTLDYGRHQVGLWRDPRSPL